MNTTPDNLTSFDLMQMAFGLTAELMDAQGVVDDDLEARIDGWLEASDQKMDRHRYIISEFKARGRQLRDEAARLTDIARKCDRVVDRVKGHASESAGASAHGGLLAIDGDASSRCGISLKGGSLVVAGDVGHFSAFMAQAGTMVVCGNAGANLGDSLYEAVIYVGGAIESLGADAREEPMEPLRISLPAAR